ncbi:beta-phosphoglucomutase family hydrolase [Celerinatantimonas sp. YJH-8]|uniref:beta-phosphoglucomutase family hydrolase n=1 Tax=Celerinatantimonas sp. YJH-8 TaxID=3228714 RepID=UPI0038C6F9F5
MYSAYQALIFDMDGTVIDSLPAHQKAWEYILERYHIPYTPQVMNYLNGWPSLQTVEYLCERSGLQELDIQKISDEKEQFYREIAPTMVKPTPIVDIVKTYFGQKPLALGTGAMTHEATSLLKHLGIRDYFQVIVGADQVVAHKPAPDTFLRCAAMLGIEPKDCLVFEDAEAGLEAAKKANMSSIDVRTIWQGQYFVVDA